MAWHSQMLTYFCVEVFYTFTVVFLIMIKKKHLIIGFCRFVTIFNIQEKSTQKKVDTTGFQKHALYDY